MSIQTSTFCPNVRPETDPCSFLLQPPCEPTVREKAWEYLGRITPILLSGDPGQLDLLRQPGIHHRNYLKCCLAFYLINDSRKPITRAQFADVASQKTGLDYTDFVSAEPIQYKKCNQLWPDSSIFRNTGNPNFDIATAFSVLKAYATSHTRQAQSVIIGDTGIHHINHTHACLDI